MHIDMTMKTVLQIHGLFKYTAIADLNFFKVEGWQGRPQDLGGGQEAMHTARGVRGHAPPRNIFKTVQFGAF